MTEEKEAENAPKQQPSATPEETAEATPKDRKVAADILKKLDGCYIGEAGPESPPTACVTIPFNVLGACTEIQGWMKNDELAWLYTTAKAQTAGARWVEIGSWRGRSTRAVVAGLPQSAQLFCVDTFRGSAVHATKVAERGDDIIYRTFLKNMQKAITANPGKSASIVRIASPEAAELFSGHPVDVVFIDGDHRYKAVMADIATWRKVLKPGGLLCGHDRWHKGVARAIKESFSEAELATIAVNRCRSIWWLTL